MYENLAILALFAFAYALVGSRLARTPVNGALVYAAFGLLAGPVVSGVLHLSVTSETVRAIAELTLALVLFSDAANANLSVLRQYRRLPIRLLLVGLPLTIALGFALGRLILPDLGLFEVAILATMLAPTDAALGRAVVTNEVVPAPVREGLNVESGLNDGICVPILFLFLALATKSGIDQGATRLALTLVAEEFGIGAGIGIGLAVLGSIALRQVKVRGWLDEPWTRLLMPALAFAIFGLAQAAGGSGFIACFTGGMTFGALVSDHKHELLESSEAVGEIFSLLTWVVFGAVVILQHNDGMTGRVIVYAVLSLTVIRMLPVYLCLTGLHANAETRLFVGWFGPRGLASIVFLVIVIQAGLPGTDTLVSAVVSTVVASIVGHGLSANPWAKALGRRAGVGG